MSCPRTPTTTTSAATTTPNATPNEPYAASPATPTVWATPSASTPSKPHSSPNAASLTAIFDADHAHELGTGGYRWLPARGRRAQGLKTAVTQRQWGIRLRPSEGLYLGAKLEV